MDLTAKQIPNTEKYSVRVINGKRVDEFEAESWPDVCARVESIQQEIRKLIPVHFEGETYHEIRINPHFGCYEVRDSKGYWMKVSPGLMSIFEPLTKLLWKNIY